MTTIMDPAHDSYFVPGITNLTILAGDTQDGTEQVGLVIDRRSVELEKFKGHFGVELVVFAAGVSITAAENLQIVANLEHDDALAFSSPADFAPAVVPVGDHPAVTVAAQLNGAVTLDRLVLSQSYDISGAERFLRIVYTSTFSLGSTDTADFSGGLRFAGFRENPVGPISGVRATLIA